MTFLVPKVTSDSGSDVGQFIENQNLNYFTVIIKWHANDSTSNNTNDISWNSIGY